MENSIQYEVSYFNQNGKGFVGTVDTNGTPYLYEPVNTIEEARTDKDNALLRGMTHVHIIEVKQIRTVVE